MNRHRYLRAYMAGIVVPTIFLLAGMVAFTMARHVYHVSIPIERIIVFPMALVPNLWGLWNMLYIGLGGRVPIGLHGALLVVLILPIGLGIGKLVGFGFPYYPFALVAPAAAGIAYYLVWKYVVSFLNGLLEIQ